MPMYDYRCTECGTTYEVFQRTRDAKTGVECPSCHSLKVTKLMSAPAVSMGSGSSSYSYAGGGDSCTTGGCCGGSCGLD